MTKNEKIIQKELDMFKKLKSGIVRDAFVFSVDRKTVKSKYPEYFL